MKKQGFTIVELLIVIVVIGILAAITIVAFNGIQNKARVATVQSDLKNAVTSLESYKVGTSASDLYPANTSIAALKSSPGNNFTYIVSNTTSPAGYCLIADNSGTRYYSTNLNTTPALGSSCGTYNYATNGSAESGTTGWSSTAPSASFEQVSSPVYDGAYSMRGYIGGTGSDRFIYYIAPASGAGTWNISARVYLLGAGTTDYNRGMWVNDSGSTTSASTNYNTSILNSWQSTSLTFTTPSTSTSILVRFYVMAGYNIYVDNIIVSRT